MTRRGATQSLSVSRQKSAHVSRVHAPSDTRQTHENTELTRRKRTSQQSSPREQAGGERRGPQAGPSGSGRCSGQNTRRSAGPVHQARAFPSTHAPDLSKACMWSGARTGVPAQNHQQSIRKQGETSQILETGQFH